MLKASIIDRIQGNYKNCPTTILLSFIFQDKLKISYLAMSLWKFWNLTASKLLIILTKPKLMMVYHWI